MIRELTAYVAAALSAAATMATIALLGPRIGPNAAVDWSEMPILLIGAVITTPFMASFVALLAAPATFLVLRATKALGWDGPVGSACAGAMVAFITGAAMILHQRLFAPLPRGAMIAYHWHLRETLLLTVPSGAIGGLAFRTVDRRLKRDRPAAPPAPR